MGAALLADLPLAKSSDEGAFEACALSLVEDVVDKSLRREVPEPVVNRTGLPARKGGQEFVVPLRFQLYPDSSARFDWEAAEECHSAGRDIRKALISLGVLWIWIQILQARGQAESESAMSGEQADTSGEVLDLYEGERLWEIAQGKECFYGRGSRANVNALILG